MIKCDRAKPRIQNIIASDDPGRYDEISFAMLAPHLPQYLAPSSRKVRHLVQSVPVVMKLVA